MKLCLATDFGSTYTKLTAIDLTKGEIIGIAKAFTTIQYDIMEGFNNAFKEISAQTGVKIFDTKLASSSAAGGLKMVSIGLVPDLTSKASHLAATSAGAKVIKTYSYELSQKEQQEIYDINPDIVLLSGGIDGGNKDIILHNAKELAKIDRNFSVIIAGNKSAGNHIEKIISKTNKNTVLCENVMPVFNKLNILSAKNAIREIFIKNIISAKGLDKAQNIMSDQIIPTPLAVYDAMVLLSKGTSKSEGLDEIMAYDVGGATTDVYSMSHGFPSRPNVYIEGLNEPFAKRTVEGDIGMRYSVTSLVDVAGFDQICLSASTSPKDVENWIKKCASNPEILAQDKSIQKNIDDTLAGFAIEISAARHCGFTETVYTPIGEAILQTGKDLTQVKYIIGSGGSVINSQNPLKILSYGEYSPKDTNLLKPVSPKYLLDNKNIFAAMGLIGQETPDVSIKIMKEEFCVL